MNSAPLTFPVLNGIPVNDFHIHLSRWEDGAALGLPDFMAQLEDYRKTYNLGCINIACIPSLERTGSAQNLMAALAKHRCPDYRIHAGLDFPQYPVQLPFPQGFRPEEQLADALAVGFDGIKLLEEKPNIRKALGISFADPVFESFFARLEEEQIHLMWHVNDPESFWDPAQFIPSHPDWNYSTPGHLTFEETVQEVLTVLRRHPKLKVTFAHLFFMDRYPDRLVQLLDTYPNLAVDLAPHTEMYWQMSLDQPLWRDIFTRYSHRILFGTDYFTRDGRLSDPRHADIYRFLVTDDRFPFWGMDEAHGLGLPREAAKNILHDNFLTRLGETPKPIDPEALKRYVQKYQNNIPEADQREHILTYCARQGLL